MGEQGRGGAGQGREGRACFCHGLLACPLLLLIPPPPPPAFLHRWGGAVFPVREGVPARVTRRVCAPDPFQQLGLVPYVQTVHDRLTVEIRRGCTRGCRFCQPGMLTRPARDVAPEKVVDAVEHGMRLTGYNEFSLLSLSCSDYLALPSVGIQIKNRLKDDNVALSLPSQVRCRPRRNPHPSCRCA